MEQGNNDIRPMPEETPAQDPPVKETKPKRKIAGLDEPYEHAPPKPDGDLWAILLKPELEADKLRCDAWKEEVQNLLIFAGLFSSVVTAFVIESYKFLQPDPNNAIVILLSQITNGPNISSALSAGSSTAIDTSFTRSSSSVRINVFWFISLILSLATVLVGTIALQWLREHQSYPGFSPKQTLAVLRMRSQALEAWYVPQMFTALPLLLQGALVLFLAGLIDFTLPLGAKLATPVACIIGIILSFLAATTVLPAFQPLLLFGRLSRNTVPTPCAFKSPQSQLFRTLSGFFLYFICRLHDLHLFPYIYSIWDEKTWPTYDLEWLSLRDAWHHAILDTDPDLYSHRWWQVLTRSEFPLSDAIQCLVQAISGPPSPKHTEEYLVAAYYCFQELSTSVWGPDCRTDIEARTDRRNNYFEQLVHQDSTWYCSIAKFLVHGGTYQYTRLFEDGLYKVYIQDHCTLFHQDQNYLFLDTLLYRHHASPALRRYQQEMRARILQYLLKGSLQPLTLLPNFEDSSSTQNTLLTPMNYLAEAVTDQEFFSDSIVLLTNIFDTAAPSQLKQEVSSPTNPIYTHASMSQLLNTLAYDMSSYAYTLNRNWDIASGHSDVSNQQYLLDIGAEYSSIFHAVAKHLNDEIFNPETSTPNLLFYFSAMLLRHFLHLIRVRHPGVIPRIKDRSFTQGLSVLLDTLLKYKQWIAGGRNEGIEIKFKGWDRTGKAEEQRVERFSDEWWAEFFCNYDESGLCINSTVPSSTPPDSALPPPTSVDETHLSTPEITPLEPADIADIVISSSASSFDAQSIPNPILDVIPPEEDVHGTNTEPPAPHRPSRSPTVSDVANGACIESFPAQVTTSQGPQSELPLDGDGPPRNLPTPGDLVLDMQPTK